MWKAVTAMILALFTVSAHAQDSTEPQVAPAVPRLVKLQLVEANSSDVTRKFFGHVVARQTVDLAFQVGGQIVEFPVIEGQRVATGAQIAQLDLEPFELALDQARLQKEQADRTVTRLEKLSGSTVSQVTLDDARTSADLAGIALRNAERSLRHAELDAPFDGLVAARNVAKFSTIGAGTPVVRLHDMSDLRIEIDVPEIIFQRAGANANVDLSARFPASDADYPLEVREFNAEASQVGQTFKLTLGMPPPPDQVILPGSSVTVTAVLHGANTGIIEIPSSAVLAANDGTQMVMVFTPKGADEGIVTATPVELAASNAGAVQVLSGLEQGTEIVATGASLLKDGERVRRFTGFAN